MTYGAIWVCRPRFGSPRHAGERIIGRYMPPSTLIGKPVTPSHRRSLPIPMTTALGRLRTFLESVAKRRSLITYQELAKALEILPPHSIHRVTEALERLMEEDAAADRSSPRSPSATPLAAC